MQTEKQKLKHHFGGKLSLVISPLKKEKLVISPLKKEKLVISPLKKEKLKQQVY